MLESTEATAMDWSALLVWHFHLAQKFNVQHEHREARDGFLACLWAGSISQPVWNRYKSASYPALFYSNRRWNPHVVKTRNSRTKSILLTGWQWEEVIGDHQTFGKLHNIFFRWEIAIPQHIFLLHTQSDSRLPFFPVLWPLLSWTERIWTLALLNHKHHNIQRAPRIPKWYWIVAQRPPFTEIKGNRPKCSHALLQESCKL